MRIHRVEIAGFGPFRHKQVVDFDKFADDGLFLIAGKTGAGKTSILDAICFGLYGGAPRYDSIMGVTEKTYRSHFADRDDRTAVSVEFSTEDGRYRVERAPGYERPAVRRDGTVTVMPTAELSKAVDGAWITVASKPKLVDEALSPIRRLKREEFLQVMLLAQNRFQEFLVASTAERNQVLQTLFNTKRFEDYETLLKERRGKLAAALADSDNAVNRQLAQVKEFSADPDTQFPASPEGADRIPKLLAELTETERAKLTAAQQLAAAAAIAAETAQVEYDRRNETRKRQDQRASALAEIAELDSVTDAAQQWQQELRDAQRADVLMPLISAAEKARDTLATAMSATGQAAKSLGVFSLGAVDPELNVPAPGAANREAAAAERRLTEFAGSLGVAAEREAELPQLTTAAEVARQRLAEHDRESTARAQQLQDLDQLLQAAGGQQRECLTAAAALPAETERVARITAAIGAAVDAAEVSAQVVTQKAELAAKLGAVAAAEASVQELWRQRIAEYAGTLAAELIPGQPCPVCGAVEHPRPADPATEPVTEARLKRARKTAADLGNDAEEAAQLVGESERRLAELHARAEGKSAAEWEPDLAAATAAKNDAAAAQTNATNLADQIAELTAASTALNAKQTAAEPVREQLVREQATNEVVLEDATTRIDRAKGPFETVAERVANALAAAAGLRALVAAREAEAAATSELAQAGDALQAAVTKHAFADVAAVLAAQRSITDQDDLANRVREFADRRAGAAAVLALPELADLPDVLLDLEPALELMRTAREQASAAEHDYGAAQERGKVISSSVESINRELSAAAKLREQFVVVERLANTVQGKAPNERNMRLVDFVLAAELEDIAEAANLRLTTMSDGRYELHQDDTKTGQAKAGLGLKVLDLHTGELRTTNSLSGGEKFLASLALALGLAETVSNRAGGITLDTLFIDEGFGSLDPDTLEVAMATLDGLRAGGRTVGVISHVPAMHEAIAAKIEVAVTEGGWSEVCVD